MGTWELFLYCNFSGSLKDCFKLKGKLGMAAQACHPRTWEAEAGGTGVQGSPQLYIMFEINLGYTKNTQVPGVMAQQLCVATGFAENLSSVPSTHVQ